MYESYEIYSFFYRYLPGCNNLFDNFYIGSKLIIGWNTFMSFKNQGPHVKQDYELISMLCKNRYRAIADKLMPYYVYSK